MLPRIVSIIRDCMTKRSDWGDGLGGAVVTGERFQAPHKAGFPLPLWCDVESVKSCITTPEMEGVFKQ